MKISILKGFSFGLTSGIITTLGLIFGLDSSTGSKMVIIGGVLTIAVADAFSDALGMHISEESENKHSTKEIWESTISTFLAKFIFALTFIIPISIFSLPTALIISAIYGLTVLALISYHMAKSQKTKPLHAIFEHVGIALAVIFITHNVGDFINLFFN